MIRPSFTITAPTIGFGFVHPSPFFASWIARSMYSWSVLSLPSFLVIQKPLQDTYRGNDLLHVTDKWSVNQKSSEMDHHLRAQTLHSSFKITVPSSSFIQTILSAPESHRIMPLGPRALPPVGNRTLPWRFRFFYHNTLYIICKAKDINAFQSEIKK